MQSISSMRAQIGTLILATSAIQLANGFFTTFLSLRLTTQDFGAGLNGLVLSSYFAGFTLGALRCGQIIERIGHIRAYAAFAGLVVAATAAMPLWVGPYVWSALRATIGFGCAGVFVTTESWLNAKAQASARGRVFSIYMVGTFLALAAGQYLIGQIELEDSGPFNAIIGLFALALVMVSTTRAEPPLVVPIEKLAYGHLFRDAPIAVVGCVANGLISSAFYALVPAWMEDEGISRDTVALAMLVTVTGGLVFQVPIGRLSDRFDRRAVLAALGFGFAGSALALVRLPHSLPLILPVAALLGGFMSSIYPVCVAYAHDQMPGDRVVAVSGQLILISGLGSVAGPLIGTGLMALAGLDGLFYFMAASAIVLALIALGRRLVAGAPEHLQRSFEILAPQATPLAHDPCHFDSPQPGSGQRLDPAQGGRRPC
ncbi:MFS transporter [Variovorax sp. J2P1-59]|uniref:MFS transporter n=1 Tax=Variovorax flavidus TaxID=3053501 RepID=UPI0025762C34|nr:MFS transporter [Variovorax sp. J2P1-59]MDM0078717.1 MFS transporter [Variovorax sp. J2P1-59]